MPVLSQPACYFWLLGLFVLFHWDNKCLCIVWDSNSWIPLAYKVIQWWKYFLHCLRIDLCFPVRASHSGRQLCWRDTGSRFVTGDVSWKSLILLFCVLLECCAASPMQTWVYLLVCTCISSCLHCLLPLTALEYSSKVFDFKFPAFWIVCLIKWWSVQHFIKEHFTFCIFLPFAVFKVLKSFCLCVASLLTFLSFMWISNWFITSLPLLFSLWLQS